MDAKTTFGKISQPATGLKAVQQESVAKNAHKIQRGKHDSKNRWLSKREPQVKQYIGRNRWLSNREPHVKILLMAVYTGKLKLN